MNDHTFIAKNVRGGMGLLVALCLLSTANTELRAEETKATAPKCQSSSIYEQLDDGVMRAYDRFSKPMFHASKASIVEDLRFWMLGATSPEISCMREEMVRRGYLPGFVEMFDDVADWIKRVDVMTGEEVYNLAQQIDNDPARTRTGKLISGNLMRVASEKKYPPALRAVADRYFNEKDNRFANCRGAKALSELAKLGDHDAALELARLYMSGDRVKASDESALFWFGYAMILAQANDLDDEAKPLFERMSDKERYLVGLMIRSDTFPICRDKNK